MDACAESRNEGRAGPCEGTSIHQIAALRSALDRLGDTWSVLILATLREDVLRHSELLEGVPGISQRMLTGTLRRLEAGGFVSRRSYGEVPPRVEYQLTTYGLELLDVARTLATERHASA